jgi:hypothetical protein
MGEFVYDLETARLHLTPSAMRIDKRPPQRKVVGQQAPMVAGSDRVTQRIKHFRQGDDPVSDHPSRQNAKYRATNYESSSVKSLG